LSEYSTGAVNWLSRAYGPFAALQRLAPEWSLLREIESNNRTEADLIAARLIPWSAGSATGICGSQGSREEGSVASWTCRSVPLSLFTKLLPNW
jgi:hypothetical protein